MSTTARFEREENAPRPAALTQEVPLVSAELRAALLDDQAQVRREVIIWQRWVRYLALGTMVLLTLVFSRSGQTAFLPLGVLAAAYASVVLATTWLLRTERAVRLHGGFPSLLVASDIG